MFNFNGPMGIAVRLDCKMITGGLATVRHWPELEYFADRFKTILKIAT